MKTKLRKLIAIGASLALISSFAAAVPVSAQPGCNAWDDINGPDLAPNTEPGVMDIAPDGTMFLALWANDQWTVQRSEDGGFLWTATTLPAVDTIGHPWDNAFEPDSPTPVSIKVSPMWEAGNKNVYVALSNGTVWRLPNEGKGTPSKLRSIISDSGNSIESMGMQLWDMDIWADGTYNYLAVATDLDVFVIQDRLLESWEDYQLNVDDVDDPTDLSGPGAGDDWRYAVEVRFDPKFAENEMLWAIVTRGGSASEIADELVLTSADSPARWAHHFEEVGFVRYNDAEEEWTPFVDMEFDPDHSFSNPRIYVGVAELALDPTAGNLYYVEGELDPGDVGDMLSEYIFFEDQSLGTVEVAGGVIITQNTWDGTVYVTEDRGANWTEDGVYRSPSARFWGQLYMHPDYADNDTIYSTVMNYNNPSYGISGVYRSTDGGYHWDGISKLDMSIDSIVDLAFDPNTDSNQALMVARQSSDDYIFYTDDAAADEAQWVLKDSTPFNLPVVSVDMISWDEAGANVMFVSSTDHEIHRSSNDGNSFARWRAYPDATIGSAVDFYVVDRFVVSILGEDGYWGTHEIGLPTTRTQAQIGATLTGDGVSIDRDGNNIAVGWEDGHAVSRDAGRNWTARTTLNGDVYVAFGDGKLYAADEEAVYSIRNLANANATAVSDDFGDIAEANFTGIWASDDNPTLYAMGTAAEAAAGLVVPDDTVITLYNPEDPEFEEDYIVGTDVEIRVSEISVLGDNSIQPGDEVLLFSADVKASSSSRAAGEIWVAKDGDPNKGLGVFDIVINDAGNPFAMFGAWPADISVEFEPFDVAAAAVVGPADTMYRLLLSADPENVWEDKPLEGAARLWGTPTDNNSNIMWTVVGTTIWALEDHNTVQVAGATVEEINKDATSAEKDLRVTWSALTCTSCYEIWVDGELYTTVTAMDGTSFWAPGTPLYVELEGMAYNTEYEVEVRACAYGRLQSRLSDVASVTTECYVVPPTPQVPAQGLQDASLAPSFVWAVPTEGCEPASYDFQMGIDPNFDTTIIDTNIDGTGYTYEPRDLDYDTNHYWRVRSVASDGVKSAWTTVQNFHTMEEPVEMPEYPSHPTPTQPPDVTLTVPPPQTIVVEVPPAVTLTQTVTDVPTPTIVFPDQPTPAYIWVIVAVGAILVIAVIVLIIRTRRAE